MLSIPIIILQRTEELTDHKSYFVMKNILFATMLLICKGCVAQTTSKPSEVIISSEIKSPVKGDVKFSIKNESDSLQYYYVGLETQDENKNWIEVVGDVNMNKDPRSVKISNLRPNETFDLFVNMPKVLKGVSNGFRHFRLKISYGDSVDSLINQIYSTPFDVER